MRKSRLLGKAGKELSFLAEGVPIKAVGSAVARPLSSGGAAYNVRRPHHCDDHKEQGTPT